MQQEMTEEVQNKDVGLGSEEVRYATGDTSEEVQNKVGGMGSDEVRYATGDLMSGEDQNEYRGMGSEEVRYATGDMMSGELQKKDGGMESEEVRYATGNMMSGEDQNEDRGMGSEELMYATGDMMSREVQNEDRGMGSEEVRYATGDIMLGEDQNDDRVMGSEEVMYATGDMMSQEVQNEDEGMGSEELRYATADMMAEEVQNKDGGKGSEEVRYATVYMMAGEGQKDGGMGSEEVRHTSGATVSQEVQNKAGGIGSDVRYATGYMMSGEVRYEAGGMGSEKLNNTPEGTGRFDEGQYRPGDGIEEDEVQYRAHNKEMMTEDTESQILTNDVWLAEPVLQDLSFNENLDSAGNDSLEDEESILTESEPYTTKSNETESDVKLQQRGRKRVRDESNWSQNLRKRLKNTGKVYINKKGITKPARILKQGCGENCRFNCHKNFSPQEREEIFHSYWELGDITRQRDFLSKYCKAQNKRVRTVTKSRRTKTLVWSLPSENNSYQRVCKTFFYKR